MSPARKIIPKISFLAEVFVPMGFTGMNSYQYVIIYVFLYEIPYQT